MVILSVSMSPQIALVGPLYPVAGNPVALVLFFQQHIIEGLTQGGIKK
jgi:hypothetical protein